MEWYSSPGSLYNKKLGIQTWKNIEVNNVTIFHTTILG
jgi:hypothetical protein